MFCCFGVGFNVLFLTPGAKKMSGSNTVWMGETPPKKSQDPRRSRKPPTSIQNPPTSAHCQLISSEKSPTGVQVSWPILRHTAPKKPQYFMSKVHVYHLRPCPMNPLVTYQAKLDHADPPNKNNKNVTLPHLRTNITTQKFQRIYIFSPYKSPDVHRCSIYFNRFHPFFPAISPQALRLRW